ncbi:MAG TPA: hypothetical protein VEY07_03815 [Thermoplasmata archaeon]|nr:hypothetical protein [Thermoplasmata archaeon]
MVALSSQDSVALLIVVIIVAVIVRRSVAMAQGTTLSLGQLIASGALYVVLFGVVALEELLILPIYVVVVEAAIVVLVGLSAAPWVQRRVSVYQSPGAGWSFRLGVTIPVIYVGLFVLRIALDFLVLGIDPFGPPPAGFSLSPSATALLVAVDGLYAVSTGLVIARTLGIYRAYAAVARSSSRTPA